MHSGIHYTEAHRLDSIMAHGLIPCPIISPTVRGVLAEGVWVYLERQCGRSHHGLVVEKVLRSFDDVVVLGVEWPDEDDGRRIHPDGFTHIGTIGDLVIHEAEPHTIVVRRIPPERIRVLERACGTTSIRYLLKDMTDDEEASTELGRFKPRLLGLLDGLERTRADEEGGG